MLPHSLLTQNKCVFTKIKWYI